MSRLPPLMVLWIMCLAAVLPGHVSAASITNYFGGSWDWPLHTLTINVGDTVLWINQQPRFIGSNYVETFTAEFKSPLLDEGNSFSFTFTKSGFYAYRTGTHKHAPVTPGTESNAGTVIVNAWTGAPPVITINFPYENAVNETHLQASVTNEPNTVEVQYFTNSVFAGSATNPPYAFDGWNPGIPPRTPYTLTAKAIDRQGGETWSSPVDVFIQKEYDVWGARLLSTGELLFYYNASPFNDVIASFDSVASTNKTAVAGTSIHGVFVDERVHAGGVQKQFYTVAPGLP